MENVTLTAILISRTLFVATMCDQFLCSRKYLYPSLQSVFWSEPVISLEIPVLVHTFL